MKKFADHVPENKRFIFDYTVMQYFTRDYPRFTGVGFKLEDAGIKYLGDFIGLTEEEFRKFTKNEAAVAHVKERLAFNNLTFGMEPPSDWVRPHAKSQSR